ncbi:MAG TPA: hypothetical protein VGM05_09145 [Planctomycetaceae bacterium]|jgi:hypothetical protein
MSGPFKCKYHPGRPAVFDYDGSHYCEKCQAGYEAAVQAVKQKNPHVEPKDCFVDYGGGDIWNPLPGTGCTHWAAHQKNLKATGNAYRCLKGFWVRVPDLANYCRTAGTEIKGLKDVKVGDMWFDSKLGHNGIVYQVLPAADPTKADYTLLIGIRHDSSGQGRVAENNLQWLITAGKHGPGLGTFFRLR